MGTHEFMAIEARLSRAEARLRWGRPAMVALLAGSALAALATALRVLAA